MTSRTPEAEALTDLILEVFRVNGDLLGAGDQLTREFRQTSSRWQVLGALRGGPQTVAGVAREMGLARQSVQRTADLLAGEGLLEYVDNPAHRRAKLVRLSATGKETLAAITDRQAHWTNGLGEAIGLDPTRISDATDVLRRLRTELEGPRLSTIGAAGDGRDDVP
jgi:DNA-binding MarR family transcriptional regulator